MERLTVREKNGFVTLGKRPKGCLCPTNFCNYEKCEKRADRSCSVLMALDRLAAYEDTGLEPREISAAMKDGTYAQFQKCNRAHYEGRLLVLPTVKTNADKIRQMTDDELAEFLEAHCYQYGWLDWLKQGDPVFLGR